MLSIQFICKLDGIHKDLAFHLELQTPCTSSMQTLKGFKLQEDATLQVFTFFACRVHYLSNFNHVLGVSHSTQRFNDPI